MKRAAPILALLVLTGGSALADGHGARGVPANPSYREECGSCHVPFPPGLLPAESWKRLMSTLPKHFGSDASLDATLAASLDTWLQANASRRRMEAPPEDRITRGRWFQHEHDEVPTAAWKRASIKSPANCAACHQGAAEGRYDEHAVRIPS